MARVTVITPTWGLHRYRALLDRCIPSVRAQTFRDWTHLVVSDGPDPALRERLAGEGVTYLELPEHVEPHSWGASARNRGLQAARSPIVAYLDSDNAWRPDHLERLVNALERSSADFAYSRMCVLQTGQEIGADPPALGQIDTSLIAHRRSSTKKYGGWLVEPTYWIDWLFVQRWMNEGATWSFVPAVTVDYYLRGS